ncbi:MAG: hypothetical protein ABJD11_01605 [Gemmatimonadota bacterium]
MSHPKWPLVVFAFSLIGISACDDGRTPSTPTGPTGTTAPVDWSGQAPSPESARLERLAGRFARALADSGFRARVRTALDASPFPEHKIHLGRFLSGDSRRGIGDLAHFSGETAATVDADLADPMELEVYLPVPAQRRTWNGDERVLVATAVGDRDIPVAFDLHGGRHFLDPNRPPETPVIAIVPRETDFDRQSGPAGTTCAVDQCGTGGGGGATPSVGPVHGLYLTYAHFTDTFEGWLKGSPEYEIHILGQAGTSDSLTDYQCAGEKAGGPYSFDQNSLDWSGSVLLFSQAQLDQYHAQHPGQSVRVFALEDDDGACQIKMDDDRVAKLFNDLKTAYGTFTAGRDSVSGLQRYWKRAPALLNLFRSAWSVITTQDDLIGNAVEDAVVGQYHPGANWIVRGENNTTTGWLELEMR